MFDFFVFLVGAFGRFPFQYNIFFFYSSVSKIQSLLFYAEFLLGIWKGIYLTPSGFQKVKEVKLRNFTVDI